MMNDEEIERLRIFAEITGDHYQTPVAGRMLHKLADAIEQLRKERDQYRLEGWQAAREMALEAVKEAHDEETVSKHINSNECRAARGALDRCYKRVERAMQPPDEWNVVPAEALALREQALARTSDSAQRVFAKHPPLSGQDHAELQEMAEPIAGPVSDMAWPHPDGFAGGLTERRIDDGEGEESKKAT